MPFNGLAVPIAVPPFVVPSQVPVAIGPQRENETVPVGMMVELPEAFTTAESWTWTEPVPIEDVAGRRKPVPPDHGWVIAARHVGTCLGD